MKRALRTALEDPEQTVIVSTGRLLITYSPNVPGEPEQTFMDGVRAIEGDDPETLAAFQGVAGQYLVQKGLAELADEAK